MNLALRDWEAEAGWGSAREMNLALRDWDAEAGRGPGYCDECGRYAR
jgi:hypothetical protein